MFSLFIFSSGCDVDTRGKPDPLRFFEHFLIIFSGLGVMLILGFFSFFSSMPYAFLFSFFDLYNGIDISFDTQFTYYVCSCYIVDTIHKLSIIRNKHSPQFSSGVNLRSAKTQHQTPQKTQKIPVQTSNHPLSLIS